MKKNSPAVQGPLDGEVRPALTLTTGEVTAILGNPHGLRLLMDYADLQHTEAASMLEPDELGSWPTPRWTALYERGRSIMAEDLELWDDDVRQAFGFPRRT